MGLVQLYARSLSKVSEVLPEDTASAELMVENAVGNVLLDYFGEVTVKDVSVEFLTGGERECCIKLEAECDVRSFRLLPCTKEYMEGIIATSACTSLKELFGPLVVERVCIELVVVKTRQR